MKRFFLIALFWSLSLFLSHLDFQSLKVQSNRRYGDLSVTTSELKAHSQVWYNFWQLNALFKMMKNAFHFTSKAVFVLKIFKFLSWLFGHVAKRLDKKDKVNFKFYDVTNTLPNISKSKGNQIMKFGQLINVTWNIFIEKSYTKYDGDTSSRPFSGKLKLSISLDQ